MIAFAVSLFAFFCWFSVVVSSSGCWRKNALALHSVALRAHYSIALSRTNTFTAMHATTHPITTCT
jgi:hypothetical protein